MLGMNLIDETGIGHHDLETDLRNKSGKEAEKDVVGELIPLLFFFRKKIILHIDRKESSFRRKETDMKKKSFRNIMFVAGMIFGYRMAKKKFRKKLYIEVVK